MQELELYKSDFEELVDTLYLAHIGISLPYKKNHLKALYRSAKKARSPSFKIDREDISQELAIMWLRFIPQYYKSKPDVGIRQYIIRRSIWGLRDWYSTQYNSFVVADIYEDVEREYIEREEPNLPFKLDLAFLLSGTNYQPLANLTKYERYLIFLKFKEERTIFEIAEIVQHTRKTVGLQYKKLMDKIRRNVNG